MNRSMPPCPSPTPGVYSNSCPSSRWCHPAISYSVVPFSSCLQPLRAPASFPTSKLFAWGGQSIGVSASAFPMSTQDWSPLGWTGWISLQSKGLSRVFSNTLIFILISRINLWFSFFDTVIILVCFLYQDNAIPLKYRGKCILLSYVVKRNIAKF